MKTYGKAATPEILTFLKRELFQKIWLMLMDEEFMEAYIHGIVLKCGDGVYRRIFIRLFTYSADYPEKYVVLTYQYLPFI